MATGGPLPSHLVTGPPGAPWLVACHGAGLDAKGFHPIARGFSGHRRVLLWDLPGHGASPPPPGRFTLAGCVDALAALLDHHGIRGATLLGFSLGGVVAQMLARRRPDLVGPLLLYGCLTPHLLPPALPPRLAPMAVALAFGWRSWDGLRRHFASLCAVRPESRAAVAAAMAPLGKARFLEVATALLRETEHDPGFRHPGPVAYLHGALDSNLPRLGPVLAALRAAYPGMPVEVVPGAGHCAHLDEPAAFAAALGRSLHAMGANP